MGRCKDYDQLESVSSEEAFYYAQIRNQNQPVLT